MADESPLDNVNLETSIAQMRRWSRREMHPTWMHTAYADLAQRLESLYTEVATCARSSTRSRPAPVRRPRMDA
jgi:hypothetical protein